MKKIFMNSFLLSLLFAISFSLNCADDDSSGGKSDKKPKYLQNLVVNVNYTGAGTVDFDRNIVVSVFDYADDIGINYGWALVAGYEEKTFSLDMEQEFSDDDLAEIESYMNDPSTVYVTAHYDKFYADFDLELLEINTGEAYEIYNEQTSATNATPIDLSNGRVTINIDFNDTRIW